MGIKVFFRVDLILLYFNNTAMVSEVLNFSSLNFLNIKLSLNELSILESIYRIFILEEFYDEH